MKWHNTINVTVHIDNAWAVGCETEFMGVKQPAAAFVVDIALNFEKWTTPQRNGPKPDTMSQIHSLDDTT